MDKSIGVGSIIGLIIFSTLYVLQSTNFTKSQKIILFLFVIFPPLQWVSILILKYYNKYNRENTKEFKTVLKQKSIVENLTELNQKGLITNEEYYSKIEKIESEKAEINLKNLKEYKQLANLRESGILTTEEFETKVLLLKGKLTKLNKSSLNDKNIEYRIVDGYSEGFAVIINNDLDYGFIDLEKNIVIDFIFDYAENFKNGYAKVKFKGVFKTINYEGTII